MTTRQFADRLSRKLSAALARSLRDEKRDLRKRLDKIERVERGDVHLRPIRVRPHRVEGYDVAEHTRWIEDISRRLPKSGGNK